MHTKVIELTQTSRGQTLWWSQLSNVALLSSRHAMKKFFLLVRMQALLYRDSFQTGIRLRQFCGTRPLIPALSTIEKLELHI